MARCLREKLAIGDKCFMYLGSISNCQVNNLSSIPLETLDKGSGGAL